MIGFLKLDDKVYVTGYSECECGAVFKDLEECPNCGEFELFDDSFPYPLLTPELVDRLEEEDRPAARAALLLKGAYVETVKTEWHTYFRLHSEKEVLATFKDEETFKLLVPGGRALCSKN